MDAVRSASAVRARPIPYRHVFFALAPDGPAAFEEAPFRFRNAAQVPEASLVRRRVHPVILEEELDRGVFIEAQKLLTGDLVADTAAACVFKVADDIATEVACTFDRSAESPLRLIGLFVHPEKAAKLESAAGGASRGQAALAE